MTTPDDVSFTVTDEPTLNGAGTDFAPDELSCPDCDFVGNTKRGLSRHRNSVHGAGDKAPKGVNAARAKRFVQLEQDLLAMLMTASLGLTMAGNPKLSTDGAIVAQNAEAVAKAWANLASRNKAVERLLMSITGGVSYGEVITATALMVVPILANHGVLPERLLFAMAPAVQSATDHDGR